jgi:hypothetical protein
MPVWQLNRTRRGLAIGVGGIALWLALRFSARDESAREPHPDPPGPSHTRSAAAQSPHTSLASESADIGSAEASAERRARAQLPAGLKVPSSKSEAAVQDFVDAASRAAAAPAMSGDQKDALREMSEASSRFDVLDAEQRERVSEAWQKYAEVAE